MAYTTHPTGSAHVGIFITYSFDFRKKLDLIHTYILRDVDGGSNSGTPAALAMHCLHKGLVEKYDGTHSIERPGIGEAALKNTRPQGNATPLGPSDPSEARMGIRGEP